MSYPMDLGYLSKGWHHGVFPQQPLLIVDTGIPGGNQLSFPELNEPVDTRPLKCH